MTTIKENSQLESWLKENYYFVDGYINELGPIMKDESGKDIVRFRVGIQTKGSWKAGSKVTYREFVFLARGIMKWTYTGNQINQKIGIQEMSALEGSTRLGVEIENGTLMELECSEIIIQGPNIIKTIIKGEVSDRDFGAYFRLKKIPKPNDWIEWLHEEGIQAAWRYHGGEIISPKKVPYPDYTGWFIQRKEKMDSTLGGVFFFEVKKIGPKIGVALQNTESDNELWNTITSIIARFPKVKIKSGNCELTGKQWLMYLEDGTLPK
jgi:hypothetical protein